MKRGSIELQVGQSKDKKDAKQALEPDQVTMRSTRDRNSGRGRGGGRLEKQGGRGWKKGNPTPPN